jgi:hypothetical protein
LRESFGLTHLGDQQIGAPERCKRELRIGVKRCLELKDCGFEGLIHEELLAARIIRQCFPRRRRRVFGKTIKRRNARRRLADRLANPQNWRRARSALTLTDPATVIDTGSIVIHK